MPPFPYTYRERDVERYLVNKVHEIGGEIRKVEWIGRKGCPDRFLLFYSYYRMAFVAVWVEVKSLTGKIRPEQQREIERLKQLGQNVEVMRSFKQIDTFFHQTHLIPNV